MSAPVSIRKESATLAQKFTRHTSQKDLFSMAHRQSRLW
jgi:hypothetical protein